MWSVPAIIIAVKKNWERHCVHFGVNKAFKKRFVKKSFYRSHYDSMKLISKRILEGPPLKHLTRNSFRFQFSFIVSGVNILARRSWWWKWKCLFVFQSQSDLKGCIQWWDEAHEGQNAFFFRVYIQLGLFISFLTEPLSGCNQVRWNVDKSKCADGGVNPFRWEFSASV